MDHDIRQRVTRQMAETLLKEKALDLFDRTACEIVAGRRYHLLTMEQCLDDARSMAVIRRAHDARNR